MVIPTPRLTLREFVPEDWERVFEYQSASGYEQFHSWSQRSERDAKSFVARFIDWQKERPRARFQLAIVLRSEGRLIGNVGIRSTSACFDAELGFELDGDYWHRGYATEACNAMLGFAFDDLRLPTVRAHCIEENVASARVLKRVGMQFTKADQNGVWMKDRYWNTLHFAVTAEGWRRLLRTTTTESFPSCEGGG